MSKMLLFLVAIVVSGCASNPPVDQCADRPVYVPYKVEKPTRPILYETADLTKEGELVRAVEFNLVLLVEYAKKLENLLNSLPEEISVPKK